MDRHRLTLLALIGIVALICALMLTPYMGYILTAVLLGFLLHPLYRRMDKRIPSSAAAGILVIATVLAAVLPGLIAAGFVAEDARALVDTVEDEDLPALQELERYLEDQLGVEIDLRERITGLVQTAAGYVAARASQIVRFAANVAIGTFLMLFVQFYVLKDGNRFVEWTKNFNMMEHAAQEQLYDGVARTTRALIKGHVLVAVLQGIVAGVGLLAVGVPNVAFWTAVMILLAFIPLIGTSLVLVPASIYLVLTGSTVAAVALLVYTFLIVGITDNVARPLLVDKDAGIHEVFILIGILGGVIFFGAIGIFIGPLLFGVLKNLLDLYRESYA